ncbi:hypothetical protein L5M43_14525 [Shewanella sp. SW36]|uniref:hypothetical protein n=1 Tax=unclassified Shewanella TaxID=196818 RepID=UPI0021DAE18D|nr:MULTISPECIES: hypothetical protein [unclassified Shewanella]MCU7964153.1 hypothetical protein [Shewanella sp. SW32]MCU7972058.1 hypothetical protein [Shewanella sp. SW29]MCU7976454.1 hypothetical protein [Shewanella sp. SW36]MCU7991694.1 hypothetical protein [Shewanella sp. SW1]MCU8053074.1 hypothetical protein [Shewanella sp. SM43]
MALVRLLLITLALFVSQAYADVQRIFVQTEIDDDHIIIVTEKGEQLLLEKWSLKFSPLLFEGKSFLAEISPLWVTIHIEDRDPIKWSIEKNLGNVDTEKPKPSQGKTEPKAAPTETCYKTNIQEPTPFNGNGGELIMLADGSIWKDSSYLYLYLYEYYPEVVLCPSEGKMILESHVFHVTRMK